MGLLSDVMEADVARILDANFNRAREALRVMEDHARFATNDAALAEALKRLRHGLADAFRLAGLDAAIAMRDTPGDVGTRISTESERERSSTGAVVRAAGKRLSEALRVLEEYGKMVEASFAGEIERLRYRGYALEKRQVRGLAARARFGQVRLYVLVTERLCRGRWEDVVRAAVAGGADCFQLREKGMSDGALLARAREFCRLCRELGVLSVINDRADVAVAVGADGVHVGQDDVDVASVRRIVGAQGIVGVSTHSAEQVAAAVEDCPDYIAVGPMFATAVKPEVAPVGPELLRAARALTSLPLVAIGGIEAENVGVLAEAGAATCAAVCSAIIGAENPEAEALRILAALDGSVAESA